jgi:hypothetical protein
MMDMKWFKGNVHTHTARSDGDISLGGVIRWYATRGYDWLAITDHNIGLNRESAEKLSEQFGILIIPGNELSGTGHVVGLGIADDTKRIDLSQKSVKDSLQAAVDWIRDRNGVPILAHPNWGNTFGADVIEKIRGCNLFEIHNASPDCNTFAAGGYPGTDEIWNDALNRGVKLYGVGSDDSHHYLPELFHSRHASAHGGEGWTYAECKTLNEKSVLAALESGRCVASSGAYPVKVGVQAGKYVVHIDDPYPNFHFTIEFIGPDGVLAKEFGRKAAYKLTGKEDWVRARVFSSSGRYLWTQPAFKKSGKR